MFNNFFYIRNISRDDVLQRIHVWQFIIPYKTSNDVYRKSSLTSDTKVIIQQIYQPPFGYHC